MRRGREKVCRCRTVIVDGMAVRVRCANGEMPSAATLEALRDAVRAFVAHVKAIN